MKFSFLKTGHWPLTIGSALGTFFSMAIPIVLTRVLSLEEIGIYKLFFLYVVLVPWAACSWGFTNALSYWTGQGERGREAIDKSFKVVVLLCFAVFLGLGFTQSFWGAQLHFNSLQRSLFVTSAILVMIQWFFDEYWVAYRKTLFAGLYLGTFEVLRSVCMLISVLLFKKIDAALLSYASVTFLKVIIGYFLFKKDHQKKKSEFRGNPISYREVAQVCLPFSGAALLAIGSGYIDKIFLSHQLTVADFAIYMTGCLSIPFLSTYEQSINRVMIAELSHVVSRQDWKEAQNIFIQGFKSLAKVIVPASLIVFFFSELIIVTLFSEKFLPSVMFLKVFSLSYLCYLIPYDTLPRAQGNSAWSLKMQGIGIVLSTLFCILGYFYAGAYGSLVGIVTAQFTQRAIGVSYLYKKYPRLFNPENTLPTIIFVTQFLTVGGLEKTILRLSTSLKEENKFSPLVFVYDKQSDLPTLDEVFKEKGIEVCRIQKKSGFSWRVVVALTKLILKRRVRLIHSHDLGALVYASFAKVMTLFRVKIIHTQHSFIHFQKRKIYALYERVFSSFCEKICVVSKDFIQQYERLGISSKRIFYTPNAVSLDFKKLSSVSKESARKNIVSQYNLSPQLMHKKWMLSLARIIPSKKMDIIIDLLHSSDSETQENICYFILGAEVDADYVTLLKDKIKNSSSPYIFLLGNTNEPELWFTASDIFVSASLVEGMPLAPFEAAAAGLRLLLSPIQAHLDMVQSIDNIEFLSENLPENEEKLRMLVKEPVLRENKVTNSMSSTSVSELYLSELT